MAETAREVETVLRKGDELRNEQSALRSRAKRLKDNYNLTPEEADAIYRHQGNVCAICRKPERSGKRLSLDHCHKTGLIRGALCSNCNRVFGKLENRGWTVAYLYNLIAYLLNPPAIQALGKSVFGFAGRCGTKRHRKAIRLQRRSQLA